MYERCGDHVGLAIACTILVLVYQALGQAERMEEVISQARASWGTLGDAYPFGRAAVVYCDGFLALMRGETEEAERHLVAFVSHEDNKVEYAKALMHVYLADFSEARGDIAAATSNLERAHALGVELTIRGQEVPVLARLANLAVLSGDPQRASLLYQEADRAARAIGYTTVLALTLDLIAARQSAFGHHTAAAEAARRALPLHQAAGNVTGSARALVVLGRSAEDEGDVATASARYGEALADARRAGEDRLARSAVEGLAAAALIAGDGVRAAQLLGASRRVHERERVQRLDVATDGFVFVVAGDRDVERSERIELAVRTAIGPDAFNAALAEGELAGVDVLLSGLSPTVAAPGTA
jgi:tetratricopeptide (TPR) repeat protein